MCYIACVMAPASLERYDYAGKANSIISRNELCKFDVTCNDMPQLIPGCNSRAMMI
jgi:hypothetical protein